MFCCEHGLADFFLLVRRHGFPDRLERNSVLCLAGGFLSVLLFMEFGLFTTLGLLLFTFVVLNGIRQVFHDGTERFRTGPFLLHLRDDQRNQCLRLRRAMLSDDLSGLGQLLLRGTGVFAADPQPVKIFDQRCFKGFEIPKLVDSDIAGKVILQEGEHGWIGLRDRREPRSAV